MQEQKHYWRRALTEDLIKFYHERFTKPDETNKKELEKDDLKE